MLLALFNNNNVLISWNWHVIIHNVIFKSNFSLYFSGEVMSTDQSLLKLILENHFLKLKVTLSELYNGQLLETLAGKLLRVFIYRTVRTTCVFVCSVASGSLRDRKMINKKWWKDNGECWLPSWKFESYYRASYQVLTWFCCFSAANKGNKTAN